MAGQGQKFSRESSPRNFILISNFIIITQLGKYWYHNVHVSYRLCVTTGGVTGFLTNYNLKQCCSTIQVCRMLRMCMPEWKHWSPWNWLTRTLSEMRQQSLLALYVTMNWLPLHIADEICWRKLILIILLSLLLLLWKKAMNKTRQSRVLIKFQQWFSTSICDLFIVNMTFI